MLEHFFAGTVQDHGLHGTHHAGLVLLSLFVSIFSATMALQIADLARKAERQLYRHVAIGTGAIALGGGIWSMHFIGMLSFQLPTHIHYSTGLTLFSLLPACAASWLALRMLSHQQTSARQLVVSGSLVGLGICTMHYTGMAAMQMPLQMRYDPVMFLLSFLLAIALAIFALWMRYGLWRTTLRPQGKLLISGFVLGSAIASMHYTGMAAARFYGDAGASSTNLSIDTTLASLVLAAFSITATILVFAINGLIRSRELYRNVEEGRSRMRAILDTAIDGIITIDSNGLIQSLNKSAERLFGWTTDEVIGRNIKMLMPEPDQSRHDGYLHNYQTSGIPKIIGKGREVMGLRKDRSLMPMRLAVGRVDLPNELLFVGFVTDISDRHALETSLRETAERAERAAAAKSTFLANMSHEIRTPMNSIIGFTELLLQGDLTPTQRNHLNTVRQSSRTLLALINDILDTTRMEKGNLSLEAIDFSLKGLALQIESALRLDAQAKGLALVIRYPDAMPEHFRGDPLRVLQVLTNLVGNAIKFTERGRVTLSFSHTDGMTHIQVQDTGIGMTAQQAATIFAPFTQADASISRRFGGSGLGTTIARQLVDLMGGSIRVDSEPGSGSTFHVVLPLPPGDRPAGPATRAARQALPPLRILIADDIAQNRELLSLSLGGAGHQVICANDGNDAVEAFMADRFDVVLMDVHMPMTDGLQATRLIRQYERTQGLAPTPVIALTASVMEDDKQHARQAGMDGFAAKPLDITALCDEILRVLAIRQAGDSPTATAGVSSAANSAATPATPAAPAQPVDDAIDWQLGESLWGSRQTLQNAIQRFLTQIDTDDALPDAAAQDINWSAVQFSLHRIHGAAGNLAMTTVSRLAGTLEQELRAGGDPSRLLPRMAELRACLQAARNDAVAHGVPTPQPEDGNAPAARAGLHLQAMRQLLSCLTRCELDDALLETVCGHLQRHDAQGRAQALRNAVDEFDFRKACTLLQGAIDAERAALPTDGTPEQA